MSDLEKPSASLMFRLKSVSVEKLLSVESMPLASAVLMCHQAADMLERLGDELTRIKGMNDQELRVLSDEITGVIK